MTSINAEPSRWLLWLGKGLGAFAAGFWFLAGVAGAFFDNTPWSWESSVLTVLILASVIAVALAWVRVGLGGWLVLIVGLAHAIFAYAVSGHNRAFAVSITGVPFIISGILLLLGWRSSRGNSGGGERSG